MQQTQGTAPLQAQDAVDFAPAAADNLPAVPPPSLTPQQISQFAQAFYAESLPFYQIFRNCQDALGGWRGIGLPQVAVTGNTLTGLGNYMRPRDVFLNHFQSLYRNAVARFATEKPSAGCKPASASAEDVAKAQAAGLWLSYHWDDAKVRSVLQTFTQWLVTCGTAGLQTYMDGTDVRQKAIPPDRLRAEPGLDDWSESRFLGVVHIAAKDDLKRQFPDHADAIDAANPPEIAVPSISRVWNVPPPDRVQVLEAYCKSGHAYLLTANGTVLAESMLPANKIPLQIVRYTEIPGQTWGMGMIEPTLDAVYAYSHLVNQQLRNARLMSAPKVLIERNSKVANDAFTSAVGEKILYSGTAPVPWTPPGLPAYVINLGPTLQSNINDLAGIHPTSTGKRATGITSGRAIEALSSNDLAQLQVTQDRIEDAVTEMATCALLFAQAFYPEDKVIRQFAAQGAAVYRQIQATDLAEDPDVFVESGTLFANDVASRDARTLDMARMGWLTPEQAKKIMGDRLDPMSPVQAVADLDHWLRITHQVAQNAAKAEVYPTDNLKVGESVVADFMRTDEYAALPDANQQAVAALYKQILALAMSGQAPPEGGKPPQAPGAPALPSSAGMAATQPALTGDAGDLAEPAVRALDATEAADSETVA